MGYFKFAEEDNWAKRERLKKYRWNIYYKNSDAVEKTIKYITRTGLDPARGKEPPLYVGAYGTPADVSGMIMSFLAVKKLHCNVGGRQLYHMIFGFTAEEEKLLMQTGMLCTFADTIAYYFYQQGYQTVYAVHRNDVSLHMHIAINSVNYVTGTKFQISYGYEKERLNQYFNWLLWSLVHQPAFSPFCPVEYRGFVNGVENWIEGMPELKNEVVSEDDIEESLM